MSKNDNSIVVNPGAHHQKHLQDMCFFVPHTVQDHLGSNLVEKTRTHHGQGRFPLLFAACRFFDVTIVDHYLHCNNLILLPCGTKINNSVLDFSLTCQVLICLKFSHIHCFETI